MNNFMQSCQNNKKEIAGITDMKQLAEMIGDLHYESLKELFKELGNKFQKDAYKDLEAGHSQLCNNLLALSDQNRQAFVYAYRLWSISKNFMF